MLFRSIVLLVAVAALPLELTADETTEFAVIATVGETTIRQSTVNAMLDETMNGILSGLARHPGPQAIALQQCIDQAIVLDYLERTAGRAGRFDVSAAMESFEQNLSRSGTSLKTWLQRNGMHRSDLEFRLKWQHYWTARLQSPFFNAKKRREDAFRHFGYQFDGTQVEVAQILMKVPDPKRVAIVIGEADAIHGRLVHVQQTAGANPGDAGAARQSLDAAWEQEVLAHSDSPQRSDPRMPGYVGWIEFNTPMPAIFSAAAFSHSPGDICEPVRTTFGIHLIRVLSRKPGTRTLQQCEAPLTEMMRRNAFKSILDLHRKDVQIDRVDP